MRVYTCWVKSWTGCLEKTQRPLPMMPLKATPSLTETQGEKSPSPPSSPSA